MSIKMDILCTEGTTVTHHYLTKEAAEKAAERYIEIGFAKKVHIYESDEESWISGKK